MSTSTPQAPPTAPSPADVAALTQRVVAAWARHDADAFTDVFTEDGTMTLPGIHKKGRDEIRAYLTEAFQGIYRGTRVTGQPLEARFFGPDSGIVITQGGVLADGETEVSDEQSIRAAWIAVKQDGQWRLAAYVNTPANTPLPAPGS